MVHTRAAKAKARTTSIAPPHAHDSSPAGHAAGSSAQGAAGRGSSAAAPSNILVVSYVDYDQLWRVLSAWGKGRGEELLVEGLEDFGQVYAAIWAVAWWRKVAEAWDHHKTTGIQWHVVLQDDGMLAVHVVKDSACTLALLMALLQHNVPGDVMKLVVPAARKVYAGQVLQLEKELGYDTCRMCSNHMFLEQCSLGYPLCVCCKQFMDGWAASGFAENFRL